MSDDENRAIARADELLTGAASLPTLAEVPLRVIALLDAADVSLEAVAAQIERDPLLASRVVRLANSPLFGRVRRVDCVSRAVVRLGLIEIRTAVITLAFIDSLGQDSRIFDMREVFREAICCGSLSRQLAQDLRTGNASAAYLAGLLHGIGEIALGLCFMQRFEEAILNARRYLIPAEDALTQEFGVAPALVGARLLSRWRMPDVVVDAVEHQNAPERSPRSDSLADVIGAARRTTRAFGIGIEWPGDSSRDWREEAGPALSRADEQSSADSYFKARQTQIAELDETLRTILPATVAHRTPLLS